MNDVQIVAMEKPGKRKLLKTALIEAAEKLIVQQGWQAVRARALAETTGRALGAIYTVYPDLDSLIMDVKARILDDIDSRMDAAVQSAQASPLARLLAMADAYLDYAVDEPRRWRALFEHHLPEDAAFPDWYLPKLAKLFAHADEPLESLLPQIGEKERQELAKALFASVHGIVTLGLEGRLGETPRGSIAGRIEMVIRSSIAGVSLSTAVAERTRL